MSPGMMQTNSCGWRQAAMKNEPTMVIRKMAEGELGKFKLLF